ncbi:HEPN domain-containing protein [Desulfosporosinus youngiae]|nr:HEPN domain-containing protein [Desulfosporosinus youngiae]
MKRRILNQHEACSIEIICYHCQQSAEKYLKGYLVLNGVNTSENTRWHLF